MEKLADRVYQVFGRQALDELTEIPPNEAPVRSAITEPQLEADEQARDDSRDRIYVAAGSAAHQSQRNLYFREPPAGARPAAAARDQRSVSKHHAARRVSGGAAFSRSAVPGSGRERSPGEDRGALPASAVRSRFHARRAAPCALHRAPDSGLSRRARGCRGRRATLRPANSLSPERVRHRRQCADGAPPLRQYVRRADCRAAARGDSHRVWSAQLGGRFRIDRRAGPADSAALRFAHRAAIILSAPPQADAAAVADVGRCAGAARDRCRVRKKLPI